MNVQQAELYQRIRAFSLDHANANLPFSKRLARDNGWRANYTQRVIDEYKKFVFLAVVTGHPVSPSEPIDQVWHLHLLYTHSYWGEFCPNILQKPLHHEPTRGGVSEQQKHNDWYSKTLASYESFFGATPPADIWLPVHIQFGSKHLHRQQIWLLPFYLTRPAIVVMLFVLALTVTGCAPSILANISNPLDFKGPEFLGFYLWVAGVVILFASFLRWYLRQPANNPSQKTLNLNPYETAYLAAGRQRAIDTAIASLVQRGYLKLRPDQRTLVLKTPLPHNSDPLEQAIEIALRLNDSISQVRASVVNATNQMRDRLQKLGLLVSERRAKVAQRLPAMVIFAVLLLGISKIAVGISRNKPVGFLIVLCIITAVIGCFFLCIPIVRTTRYGDRVLADLQARHAHFRQTTTSNSSADPQLALLAFALFGTGVLLGDSLTDLKQVLISPPISNRSRDSSSCGSSGCGSGGGDGGDGDSSGCGSGGGDGGGGCGGGCGGCGGG